MSTLAAHERIELLRVAARVIAAAAVQGRTPLTVDPLCYPQPLRDKRASFVTLHHDGELRGCRGSVRALEPLVTNVARSARSAAFFDERFSPVQRDELPELNIHVSVLGPPRRMVIGSEEDLLAQLQPGVDGLIFGAESRQALFLPSVWEKLPEPRDFVEHLKAKAGLPRAFWSSTVECERFHVEQFSGLAGDCL